MQSLSHDRGKIPKQNTDNQTTDGEDKSKPEVIKLGLDLHARHVTGHANKLEKPVLHIYDTRKERIQLGFASLEHKQGSPSANHNRPRVLPTTILEDATVPRSELADMIRFIQQTAAKYEVTVGTFGHMGDGNLHPTFLTNEKKAAEMASVGKAMEEIFDQAVRLGGTITGEHGIGLAKKPSYQSDR